jgi:hypothetical protein
MINMHGSANAVSFGTGIDTNGRSIEVIATPQEIADAFTRRYQNAALRERALYNPDVLVMLSCLSGGFATDFLQEMQRRHLPIPVTITSAEAGQLSYGDAPVAEAGQYAYPSGGMRPFEERLLSLGHPPTVGDLYESNMWDIRSNSTVFAPNRNNQPVQIVEVESNEALG